MSNEYYTLYYIVYFTPAIAGVLLHLPNGSILERVMRRDLLCLTQHVFTVFCAFLLCLLFVANYI